MERDRARNPYSIPGSASDEDSTATTMYPGRTATRRPGDNWWTLLISSDQVALPVSCRGLESKGKTSSKMPQTGEIVISGSIRYSFFFNKKKCTRLATRSGNDP
jgi:hypothetical protein